jgi:hypothetical protein
MYNRTYNLNVVPALRKQHGYIAQTCEGGSSMKSITLTRGKVALVDDADYEWLNKYKWYSGARGYVISSTTADGKKGVMYMHREIMKTPRDMQTDHINGNKLDNRRSNLRICTSAQNRANKGKQSNNTAGYKGICWSKAAKKWQAQITVNKKTIYLGLFVEIKGNNILDTQNLS